MKVIVCLDDNGGMLFNNRRQSRDKVLLSDVMESLNDEKLNISSFSEKLFSDYSERVCVDDDFMNSADENSVCFVENEDLSAFVHKISEIIVYKWNRAYPSDFKCTIDFSSFRLVSETEFKGLSHENITKQVYVKI